MLQAVALSLVAAQAAWAAEITATGTNERIGTASIDVVDDTGISFTFYDIPFTDLEAQNIVLAVGDSVIVSAYVVTFPNGKVKNIAFSITYGSAIYTWHPNVPKVGSRTATLSATDENGQPCNCICIENTECFECNYYCGGKNR